MSEKHNFRIFFVMMAVIACLAAAGCNKLGVSQQELRFSTEYQAVFMDNGQTFFGKIENAGSAYPKLTDVFYIQREVNKDTNEVRNILVKRGSEWHAPEFMYINAQHIVVIEPVGADSRVSQLIKEAKIQGAAAPVAPAPSAAPSAPK